MTSFSFQEDVPSRHNCMPKKFENFLHALLHSWWEGHFSACMSGKLRTFGLDARSLITCRARIFPRKKISGREFVSQLESNNKKAMYHLTLFHCALILSSSRILKKWKIVLGMMITWENLLGFYWPERSSKKVATGLPPNWIVSLNHHSSHLKWK